MLRHVLATASLFLAVLSAAAADELKQPPRKNIILFVNDDLGSELGCYGNAAARTPNIDRLAAEGVRFDHAFCTTASCSASRSVILTGLHNHANGQYGHAHAEHHFVAFEKYPPLPVMLARAGYRTALVGKLHVAPEEHFKFGQVLKASSRNAVQMAEACRDLITAKDEKPFFLYFCPSDPHRGGGTVKVGDIPSDSFGNVPKGHPGVKEVAYSPDEVIVPPFLPDTPACRAELTQYYQSVSRVDQGLGRLREILQEAGIEKETLIVFTSDNGIAFPGAKTTLYEPGMRLPMIVYAPGVDNRAHRCDALVSHVDLAPTLLDYAGVKPPAALHGRSWLRALGEEKPAGWDEVQASHTFHEITMYYPMRVIRGRKYKFIWNLAHELEYPFASDLFAAVTWQDALRRGKDSTYGKRPIAAFLHRPEYELYDLATDPDEAHNLADSEQHKQVVTEMLDKLQAFQKRTGDPWIVKWEHE